MFLIIYILTQLTLASSKPDDQNFIVELDVLIIKQIISLLICYLLPYLFNKVNTLSQTKKKKIKSSHISKAYFNKTKVLVIPHHKKIMDPITIARNQISNYVVLNKYKKVRFLSSVLFLFIMFLCILFGIITLCVSINIYI